VREFERAAGGRIGGCVYWDDSTKGGGEGKRRACYRADVQIDKRRFRHRGGSYEACAAWLEAVRRESDCGRGPRGGAE
jgi:hypothetical protein